MLLDNSFRFPSHIILQQFDNEAVLLNITTQEHFGLDEIAALFLTQIQEGKQVADACQVILERYDVTQEQLEQDLEHLINALKEHHLIEVS